MKQSSVREQIAVLARENFETWDAVEEYFNSPMGINSRQWLLDRLDYIYTQAQARYYRQPSKEERDAYHAEAEAV